jgi:ABC-2 type transport system permease protein
MLKRSLRFADHIRLALVIAGKDLVEAVTNRTILAIAFGTLMTLLIGQAFPLLLRLGGVHTIALYEEDGARVTSILRDMEDVRLMAARTPEAVVELVREASSPMLGVVLPADAADGSAPGTRVLEGYLPSWLGEAEAASLVSTFERVLADSLSQPVRVHTEGNRVAPTMESGGSPGMATLVIVTVVVCFGVFLIPYLLTEERELHTLDALLVSPASMADIVIGKALAGVLLAAVAAGIALAINARLIMHWPLAILAAGCGVLFMAALGLLMSSLFESMANMTPLVLVLVVALLAPLIFAANLPEEWPAFIRAVIDWMPSVSVARVLKMAMTPATEFGLVAGRLASVILLAVFEFVLTTVRLRTSDR